MILTPREMDLFRHVMELGTVTAAAEAAHVSQPAVSKTLQQAEERLGFRLFLRQRKRLVPTTEAQAMYPEVVGALAAIDLVQRLGRDLREGCAGPLTLATTPTLAHGMVPVGESRVLVRDLQRAELGCVLPPGHPLAAKEVLTAADLTGDALISVAPHQPVRVLLQRAFEEAGVPLSVSVEVSQSSIACALAQAGVGIAVLDGFALMSAREQGMQTRPFRPAVPMQARLLQSRRRAPSQLAQSFMRTLAV